MVSELTFRSLNVIFELRNRDKSIHCRSRCAVTCLAGPDPGDRSRVCDPRCLAGVVPTPSMDNLVPRTIGSRERHLGLVTHAKQGTSTSRYSNLRCVTVRSGFVFKLLVLKLDPCGRGSDCVAAAARQPASGWSCGIARRGRGSSCCSNRNKSSCFCCARHKVPGSVGNRAEYITCLFLLF
jgi:hypothetical protein